MEATPKIHKTRYRRRDQYLRRHERQSTNNITMPTVEHVVTPEIVETNNSGTNVAVEDGLLGTSTRILQETERQSSADSIEMVGSPSQSSLQTVLLVNGHIPPCGLDKTEQHQETDHTEILTTHNPMNSESPTHRKVSDGSHNSSGDAMSLRETLQQLPPTIKHTRRTYSPQNPALRTIEVDSSFHRGILGYMDRELNQSSPTPSALSVGAVSTSAVCGNTFRKMQSLSDPQASPAQHSIRSRGSLEKSPRRKRSKSESRRRRERKLIAAGEMEVRQANETLMRYLKQCSEMHDTSLSGELEIDQKSNLDERRVLRKSKSQRDKRGHLINKLYSAGGLSSILKELSDDILPVDGEEIYNPFTPVISPSDEAHTNIDKMFLQTSSGYRPVKRSLVTPLRTSARSNCVEVESGGIGTTRIIRSVASFGDSHCLLDLDEFNRVEISTNIQLSCIIQRVWLLASNICHGLLAGLALAHLLFVLGSHPMNWSMIIKDLTLVDEVMHTSPATTKTDNRARTSIEEESSSSTRNFLIEDYASFAEIYLNTFYCLAIFCLISVFDRMDFSRWNFSNATEMISFRWIIITMIYMATIMLTLCSDSIEQKMYLFNNNENITINRHEMISNSVQSVWSSLSVTRSITAISGWIMVGLMSENDRFYEHLSDLAKYQLTSN